MLSRATLKPVLHAKGPGELTWMEPGSSDQAKVVEGVLWKYLKNASL